MSTMFSMMQSLKNRILYFFCTESVLVEDAFAGDDVLIVDNVTQFDSPAIRRCLNTILLEDGNTTGRKRPFNVETNQNLIDAGEVDRTYFSGTETAQILDIVNGSGNLTKRIKLEAPLQRDWLVSDNAKLTRAPNGWKIQNIYLGDIRVNLKYPAIVIIPDSKSIDWTTMSGTTDTITTELMVYIKDDDTEEATEALMKVTDALEWVLMTELHLTPTDAIYVHEKSSRSYVRNVQYSTIRKGDEFIKASTMTWEADLYFWRSLISAQANLDTEFPFVRQIESRRCGGQL